MAGLTPTELTAQEMVASILPNYLLPYLMEHRRCWRGSSLPKYLPTYTSWSYKVISSFG